MLNEAITLGKRNLVDSIWKSTAIEGLGITFPSTNAILENLPVETKRDDVYFVCNMKRAWEFLFENIDYPVNLSLCRELNRISMENLTFDAGSIRRTPVTIGGTNWVPEMPIESIIAEKLREISSIDDKMDSALELYCYMARTQAFTDGNKRLAGLLCNKVLMEHNIGIMAIPVDKVTDHIRLLVDFYETGNNKNLKEFMREEGMQLTSDYLNEMQTAEAEKDEGVEME